MTNQVIFRVVGGYSQRHIHIKYEIIPYVLVTDAPKYYRVIRNGKMEIQIKRANSNTQWFYDLENALQNILERINAARESIASSLENITDLSFPFNHDMKWYRGIYIVLFRNETFTIYCYGIEKETRLGIKTTEKIYDGKRYIYPHISKPHDPLHPFERFISRDLDSLLAVVRRYGEDRLGYLHSTKQKMIDWTRLWEREHQHSTQ